MPVYFLRGWGMLKLQIDWQEHFLSHWKALEKIKIMFLTCLIVTVILSKAKDQEKGGRKTWGGGLPVGTLLFKGNKVVYQLPNLQIILLYLEVEYLKYLTP